MPDPRSNGTKRKTSSRSITGRKHPTVSAFYKERWKDPEYRAKMMAVFARREADRKINPAKYSRHRVPDGMRKHEAIPLWAKAERLADRFIGMLKEEGDLPVTTVPGSDEAKAEAALREACLMALGPGDNKIKTANIRTVLEWTKAKPESKSKITVNKAEDWLLAAQADVDSGAD